jgi:predicted dinucleotide-binding enzyme
MSAHARTAPRPGAVRMRRALALIGCGVLGVGLAACESTEQESARIGRESEAASRAAAPQRAARQHVSARAPVRGRPLHATPAAGASSR